MLDRNYFSDDDTVLFDCSRCHSSFVGINERMRTLEEIKTNTYKGYFC